MKTKPAQRFIVSVLVADRVGILRDITAAVDSLAGNIGGISQTVVYGYFTVIFSVSFDSPCEPPRLQAALEAGFDQGEAALTVVPHNQQAADRKRVEGERYILTVSGEDRPGLLRGLTAFLAEKGINIEDWSVTFHGNHVIQMGELTLPERLDIKQVQDELRDRLADLGVSGTIQHENIFRATNEIGPIKALLGN